MSIPGSASPLFLASTAAAGAYEIPRSLRFDSSASSYLNRTPSSAGNRRTWTWSGWVKISDIATSVFSLFAAYDSSSTRDVLRFESNKLNLQIGTSGTYRTETTDALFRDPSAWYHIVAAFDSTQSTAENRLKLYVNGVEQSVTGTPVDQNTQSTINNTDIHYVGARSGSGSAELFFDGYMADVHFIDGQALAATDFGEYDDNNVWQPIKYAGTYGTNGFHLDFSDTSSNSALGTDSSGAGNNWSVNNLTAGAAQALPGVSFDGTANAAYLTIPDSSDFTLGSNDFTVEAYVYKKDTNEQFIAGSADSNGATSSASFVLQVGGGSPASTIRAYVGTAGTSVDSGENITLNKWVHVAFVRDGNTLRLYVDGVQKNSASFTGSVNDSSNLFGISSLGGFTNGKNWNGFISNLRLVNGTCLYPSGTTFTLPSAPLTNVTNTKLLCCQSSSSATATTVSPGSITVGNASNVAAGAFGDSTSADDALRDSPVNGDSANDTGAGGEITGNYATWNPLFGENQSLSNGNLKAESSTTGYAIIASTIAMKSGKWYMEYTYTPNNGQPYITWGISQTNRDGTAGSGVSDTPEDKGFKAWDSGFYSQSDGSNIYNYSSSVSSGDIISLAFDADAGKLWVAKNGTWMTNASGAGNPATGANPDYSSLTYSGGYYFMAGPYYTNGSTLEANFGQRSWAYAAPTNFKALCTANLSDPTIADGSTAFDTKLYTGNDNTQTISGMSLSPSLLWLRSRAQATNHEIFDVVRGSNKILFPNLTNSETTDSDRVTSFNSDGFGLGANSNANVSGGAVAWAWSAGDNSNHTYAVTVSNPGSGNKYYVDGALQPTLTLAEGSTYKFDQSSGTNSTHPLRFSTTSDGTHGGGSEYTTGVTTSGTPGSAGAYTQIVIAASAPTLYAYCTAHSGMGFQINTSDTAGYTIPVGGSNSAAYDQSQTWSNYITGSVDSSYPLSNLFGGNIGSGYANGTRSTNPGTLTLDLSSLNITVTTITLYTYIYNTPGTFKVNNVTVDRGTGNGDKVYTVAVNGQLNSIAWSYDSSSGPYCYMRGIEVDGKLLVDSGVSVTSVPSISSRIQADPSKGFSIVSYTGNATIGATVSHGLNAAPELIIAKTLTQTYDWPVYIKPVGPGKAFYLNSTAAAANSTGIWGNIDPTSSVFTLGGDPQANYSGGSIIAYCFAPVEQYSSFGSFSGNGSADGPFVYTGFRPAWLLIKVFSGGTSDWHIFDTTRSTANVMNLALFPNLSNSEATETANLIDALSNGFKVRGTGNGTNNSSYSYIYAAFASNPFKTSRAR